MPLAHTRIAINAGQLIIILQDREAATDEQWTALKDAWNGCAYCGVRGKPLQRDCVMAISRGGRYTIDNVVPACAACNASKCNDEVTGWLRRKRLDERAFLERYVRIRAELVAPTLEA